MHNYCMVFKNMLMLESCEMQSTVDIDASLAMTSIALWNKLRLPVATK